MGNNNMAFIIEGPKFERIALKSLESVFFNARRGKTNCQIIELPAEQNIYMLWKKLQEYEGDADIIEIVRETSEDAANKLKDYSRNDYSEVYLFFDYDVHQKNLSDGMNADDIIFQMLETFDNETENGKLYISYPMSEALRDFQNGSCRTFNGECFLPVELSSSYKNLSGNGNKLSEVKKYTENKWRSVLNCYSCRLACLLNEKNKSTIQVCKSMSPHNIFKAQNKCVHEHNRLMVLSAFPEFIYDYFKEKEIQEFINENTEYDLEYACEWKDCDKNLHF